MGLPKVEAYAKAMSAQAMAHAMTAQFGQDAETKQGEDCDHEDGQMEPAPGRDSVRSLIPTAARPSRRGDLTQLMVMLDRKELLVTWGPVKILCRHFDSLEDFLRPL